MMFQSIRHSLEGPGSLTTGLAFFVNSTTVLPRMHCAPLPVNLMGHTEIANTVSSRPEWRDNDKAAKEFVHAIAEVERRKLINRIAENVKYLSLISDGTTDAAICSVCSSW